MKRHVLIASIAAATSCVAVTAASAMPGSLLQPPHFENALFDTVRSDCRWVDNRWTYQRGDRRLVCRPNRPAGLGWRWYREGPRFGWYNDRRREWNFNGW